MLELSQRVMGAITTYYAPTLFASNNTQLLLARQCNELDHQYAQRISV